MQRELIQPAVPTERTTRLSFADRMMAVMTPTVALCYRQRLDPQRLRRSLATVLGDFSSFAGRIRPAGGELWLEHGLGGAKFEVTHSAATSEVLGAAARAGQSSLVCPSLPVLGTMRGWQPVFGARVTQTADGSILGLTWNHALGDHYTALLLLKAWACAYRDQAYDKPIEVSDRGAYLEAELPAAPPDYAAWRVLSWSDFVRGLYCQFWATQPVRRVALEFTSEEMAAIHAAAASDTFVTAHDALCAHVFLELQRLEDSGVSRYFSIALNYRKRLGLPPNLLGNLSDVVTTFAGATDDTARVASALRACIDTFRDGPITQRDLAALRAAHPNLLQHMRCAKQQSDPFQINLILSNVASFGYYELEFEDGGPAFVHARGTNIAVVGFGTIIRSPRAAGVTVDIVLPKRLAERLAAVRGPALRLIA